MDINDFAEKVCAAVEEELGSGHKAEVKEVRKNNGVILHGLLVSSSGQDIVPTVYLESFLAAHESGIPFEEAVRRVLSVYRRDTLQGAADMEFFRHYEKVKDRVCFRLVRRKGNEQLLEDVPHAGFLDLAVCFYYAYHGEEIGDGSILIHNSHVEMWGVCTEELLRQAQANTPALFPWECCTLDDVINGAAGEDGGQLPEQSFSGRVPMKVLTNCRRVDGAACILYLGVLEGIASEWQKSLYILPSSIHEVILLPDDGGFQADQLREMVSEVNRSQVPPEEVLSDSLYYYDYGKKETVMAE